MDHDAHVQCQKRVLCEDEIIVGGRAREKRKDIYKKAN